MAAKKLKIHPLDDRIVVEPVEAEERTSGGSKYCQIRPRKNHNEDMLSLLVQVVCSKVASVQAYIGCFGDEVIYGKYSGNDIEVDGHDVKILREGDILAKVLN